MNNHDHEPHKGKFEIGLKFNGVLLLIKGTYNHKFTDEYGENEIDDFDIYFGAVNVTDNLYWYWVELEELVVSDYLNMIDHEVPEVYEYDWRDFS